MTAKTVFIRPATPRADIPDPAHGFARLPYVETGVEVVVDAYWAGHLSRGDVVEVAQAQQAEEAPAEPGAAEIHS